MSSGGHSKTPGGSGASEKFQKQQAEKHGLGASNADGHTEGKAPGQAPVASDSGSVKTGVDAGTNQPGEKGIKGVPVDTEPSHGGANMRS